MARRPVTDLSAWPSISLEGNLIAPAMLARIDERAAPEQSPEDYSVRKGLTLREEISTAFRVGQSHFDAFSKLSNPSADATRRFMKAFLKETFGFDDIEDGGGLIALSAGGHRIPVIVVPPDEDRLDRRSATLSVERSRSPAFALQDYLNDEDDALWGLATNGTVIRLMRDNASLTRPAFIEADLAQIFTNEDAASFGLLWLLIHRSRFGNTGAPATDCALERWRETGTKEGEVARDRLAAQVKLALNILGSGFLEANPALAAKLKSGEQNLTEWFNELLRLVYRLIFLMVAEDRNLLHPEVSRAEARKLYADGYSLAHLRAQCFRGATWDRHHDRYEGVKIVFRSLAGGQEALALPALGGLFAPNMLPSLETAKLRNRAFMEALYRLSWLQGKTGMAPVNWRAMETEELGSVYESLLELQPQLGDDGKSLVFASDAAEQKGNQRKTTGSYYTPDSLVQALLDTALDPVLDKTEAEADDPEAALLSLSVIDPACGSGHFLLAAARRIATRVARIRADGTPAQEDFRHALRDVARSCIHGVDRNPMAVELTKVALWIETVDPGLPLGFFDAQIRCGDALLGVFDLAVLEEGIPDAAYKPLTGDDKDVAKYYREKNKREVAERDRIATGFGFNRQQDFMREFARLRAMPEDTVRQIEAKAEKLRGLTAEGATAWTLETACDLYVSAFLLPKTKEDPHAGPDGLPRRGTETVPTSGAIWEWLRGVQLFGPLFGSSIDAARKARAFHWPLEFPDVMAGGGFDVVLGNPPWERIKLQEQEFFATLSPEIASAANKAAREKLIKALEKAEPGTPDRTLFDAFTMAKREAEASSEFARVPGEDGGRFALTGRGDVNTYALFAELFANLSRKRAGVIVPTGIATDATTAPFFAHLVEAQRLARLIDFENSAPIFSGVHRSFKFTLLTLGRKEKEAVFAFFLTDPSQIIDEARNFSLSAETIGKLNPNTKTAPVVRSRADAELISKFYSATDVFLNESSGPDGNPWEAAFYTRIWHMAEDSEWFRTAHDLANLGLVKDGADWIDPADIGNRYVPLYEAKMMHIYDHRWSSYGMTDDAATELTKEQKADPETDPIPRYWVPHSEVATRLERQGWRREWLYGWRKITNTTNERTLISAVFPRSAAGDSLPLALSAERTELVPGLIANLSSLPLDYAERRKLGGTNLTFQYLFQLPVFPPNFYTDPRLAFITPRVLELTYTSHSLAPFARDLGHDGPPFGWDEDRRAALRADLDAFYARAYGLTRDELRYILDPADVMGEDYPSETFRVLMEKEIRLHGEYRTRRLVLEAWDRMEANGTFAELGLADGVATPAQQPIQLPPLVTLPDGAWARAAPSPQHDPTAALAAILKSLDEPTPIRTVRLVAVMMLEPHLLTPLLATDQQAQWRRLVGPEAEPHSGNVIGFAARTTPGWNTALTNHRGNGRLIEDRAAGTWAAGAGLEGFDTAGWPDGRAEFVLTALSALDIDVTVSSAPDEVRDWIANAAAG
ncbi:MAG: restriction endonuclease [Hyphomonas sp. BRH_c22]|uniref:site-specific DNA-methyltransferase (adenine-specific) n=1 Tax=Pyruvatibacter mobilis TaxID=1712261 RepID=A0A845QGJ6_9HYPH|nr:MULTISPECIES: N-6 DNA methylase [Alphaproteobacteria]KJS38610.1 MAG: restriction endonuclease [Hyphomonas sp. BRH_c22]NBG97066.1 N-6 DNA methylase [Pyruvatibacter mobilis]QJD76033.1 N-6 DNA methylase [Pyruvatibacter mobilis]GGD20591.1 hypothetical protein GCM10011587_26460 [Pyruvatibacter mobilis]